MGIFYHQFTAVGAAAQPMHAEAVQLATACAHHFTPMAGIGIGIANGIDKVHFTIQDNRLIFTKQQLNREYNVYQTIFDGYVLSVMEKNSEEQNEN